MVFHLNFKAVIIGAYPLCVKQVAHPLPEIFERRYVEANGYSASQLGKIDPLRISAKVSIKGLLLLDVMRIQNNG